MMAWHCQEKNVGNLRNAVFIRHPQMHSIIEKGYRKRWYNVTIYTVSAQSVIGLQVAWHRDRFICILELLKDKRVQLPMRSLDRRVDVDRVGRKMEWMEV